MPAKKASKTRTPAKAKAPTKSKKAPLPDAGKSSAAPSTSAGRIMVRMYRVGFGDCFLLTLQTADGPRYILVDCGVHSKGNIKADGTSMLGKAVEHIGQVTKRLNIVIATHPHQDHISGFGSFAEQFGKFAIDEVWMPWTENPDDKRAKALRDKRNALVSRLQAHFAALGAAEDSGPAAAVANMAGNAPAFAALHSGFGVGAKVRYFEAGDTVTEPAGIKDLKVSILGPPTDQSFLSKMDPPADDHYMRLSGGDQGDGGEVKPFAQDQWAFEKANPGLGWPELPEEYKQALISRANSPAEDLAFALDQCVNNCSIVALFAYQGKNLLFPGDAQYGNWKAWVESESASLLGNVSFYKVAHHGSVNATPKEALEKMPDAKFAAMMSTQSQPWPSIPAPGLLTALDRKTGKQWVRSDAIDIAGAPSAPKGTSVPAVFQQGQFWFDYVLD